jgi:hypothetical protein
MLATSPLAILFYVMLAMLFVSTIARRLGKEKHIAAIMRTTPSNITRIINSYKTVEKMFKTLIVVDLIAIPALIYFYFRAEEQQGIFLGFAGLLVLLIIKAFEDIQYRNMMISRLEAGRTTAEKVVAPHISEKEFEAKVRKRRILAIPISFAMLLVTITALHMTMGGSLEVYVVTLIIGLLAIGLGFWIASRQQ